MFVASAQLTVIAHATESVEKVKRALGLLCPPETVETSLRKRTVKGHFGNRITILILILQNRAARTLLERLWTGFSPPDRQMLLNELDTRFDQENRLHLRIDKQECFLGNLRLIDRDPMKLEVSFRGMHVSTNRARELLGSL